MQMISKYDAKNELLVCLVKLNVWESLIISKNKTANQKQSVTFHRTIIYCTHIKKNPTKLKTIQNVLFNIPYILECDTLSLQHDLSAGPVSSAVPVPEEVKQTWILLVLIDLNVSWVGPCCCAIRGEESHSTLSNLSSQQFLYLYSNTVARY